MEQLAQFLPPAIIVGVILFTSNLSNKRIDDFGTSLNGRIDDLRNQMMREHDILA